MGIWGDFEKAAGWSGDPRKDFRVAGDWFQDLNIPIVSTFFGGIGHTLGGGSEKPWYEWSLDQWVVWLASNPGYALIAVAGGFIVVTLVKDTIEKVIL